MIILPTKQDFEVESKMYERKEKDEKIYEINQINSNQTPSLN